MLPGHVGVLPLLCAVCHLSLALPIKDSPHHNVSSLQSEARQVQVDIPHHGPLFAALGSSIVLPCLVSISSMPTSVAPQVKWTVVSGGVHTPILVSRGDEVLVNKAYGQRATLLNNTSSPNNMSLRLGDLQHSDSAHYRCEVQQGLEDASDIVELKVKGVTFHYRAGSGRYTFNFAEAVKVCQGMGAQIATPDQLWAAYHDGYEQCDAGWLADQTVRFPVIEPRLGCYGDRGGQPGVCNYGTMNPQNRFDVYCFVEDIHGEVFQDEVRRDFTFEEAKSYCRSEGAELATTAHLYWAWSEGLDRCRPGWLSDGSVRYPIAFLGQTCGKNHVGVETIYLFSRETGFPEPSSLHDVYCFRDNRTRSNALAYYFGPENTEEESESSDSSEEISSNFLPGCKSKVKQPGSAAKPQGKGKQNKAPGKKPASTTKPPKKKSTPKPPPKKDPAPKSYPGFFTRLFTSIANLWIAWFF